MPRPVQIDLPAEASETARAVIPEGDVPRVAAAIRANTGRDTASDEECIVKHVLAELRSVVQSHERSEAVSKIVAEWEPTPLDW